MAFWKRWSAPILRTVIGVLLLLFVLGLAIAVIFGTSELLTTLTASLLSAFMASVITIVGYIVANLIAKVVRIFPREGGYSTRTNRCWCCTQGSALILLHYHQGW